VGYFLRWGVDWVVGVVVIVVGIRGFLASWVLVLYIFLYLSYFECAGLWVHVTWIWAILVATLLAKKLFHYT
jgi:hypothetical protein